MLFVLRSSSCSPLLPRWPGPLLSTAEATDTTTDTNARTYSMNSSALSLLPFISLRFDGGMHLSYNVQSYLHSETNYSITCFQVIVLSEVKQG